MDGWRPRLHTWLDHVYDGHIMGTKLTKARRTTLFIDPDLVREAQQVLHTESQSDTVRAALSEVVALRRRLALLDLELPDLTSEAVADVRRDRVFEDA
jgi:Arc/MetJ family transcription regulator